MKELRLFHSPMAVWVEKMQTLSLRRKMEEDWAVELKEQMDWVEFCSELLFSTIAAISHFDR